MSSVFNLAQLSGSRLADWRPLHAGSNGAAAGGCPDVIEFKPARPARTPKEPKAMAALNNTGKIIAEAIRVAARPLTVVEIRELTDLDATVVRNGVYRLVNAGALLSQPGESPRKTLYALTDAAATTRPSTATPKPAKKHAPKPAKKPRAKTPKARAPKDRAPVFKFRKGAAYAKPLPVLAEPIEAAFAISHDGVLGITKTATEVRLAPIEFQALRRFIEQTEPVWSVA